MYTCVLINYSIFFGSELGPGCSVQVEGDLVKSPKKGQDVELQANKIEILGACNMEVKINSYCF